MIGYRHRTANRVVKTASILQSVRRHRHLPRSRKELNAMTAAGNVDIRGGRVLVVGCGQGTECGYFEALGAAEIWGVDPSEGLGAGFPSPRVKYLQAAVQKMGGVPDDHFDLVYAHAVFEHVTDIAGGFREMVRVTRRGGVVYSLASPLWNSGQGSHYNDDFGDFPWIHLRLDEGQLRGYCHANGVVIRKGTMSVDDCVDSLHNPDHFNRLPSTSYLAAVRSLGGVWVRHNYIIVDSDASLTPEIEEELAQLGLSRQELLSLGHVFVGHKR